MNRVIIYSVLAMMLSISSLSGQADLLEGKVSFLTSSNTYVRFPSTEHIEIGDTLTVMLSPEQFRPCLVVEQKSSSSCVCRIIEACELTKDAPVYFRKKADLLPAIEEVTGGEKVNTLDKELFDTDSLQAKVIDPQIVEDSEESLQSIRARVSASSYSSLDPDNDRHRMMMRFSFDADKIDNSNFSFESYINYRRNIEQVETADPRNSMLRIYNLAVRYDNDSTHTHITLGRSINNRMSSVGAIDGVQVQKDFNRFYTGAILGFRPDIIEFDFNPSLLEYGFYVGADLDSDKTYGQVTMGVLEQRNSGAIDRRYSYFQFSSTFSRKLNIFASGELDLYSNDGTTESFEPQLTNILISARYRFNRKISFNLSFDSRKRIIYYETLRTELERLLADDEARQRIRARINLKPIKYVYLGVSYSKRFQNSAQNKSDNYNGFVSLSKVPGVKGRLSVSYNLNKSNYQNTNVVSLRHSRTIVKRKLDADLYYRYVKYDYFNSETTFDQYYLGGGLSWNIMSGLSFNLLVEHSNNGDEGRYRINTKLIKRFRS